MAWTGSQGGGDDKVGKPGRSMEMLSFDEKTRPITRGDIFRFMADPNNTSDEEKQLIQNCMLYGISGSALGFVAGYQLSKLLPLRWLEKKSLSPFPGFVKFARFSFG